MCLRAAAAWSAARPNRPRAACLRLVQRPRRRFCHRLRTIASRMAKLTCTRWSGTCSLRGLRKSPCKPRAVRATRDRRRRFPPGFVNALYKVSDHFEAFFDPHKFCSLSSLEALGRRFASAAGGAAFRLFPRQKRGGRKEFENRRDASMLKTTSPACVTDVVSGFYYLSSLPLQEGNSYTFPINDGGKTTEVSAPRGNS